MKLCSIETIGLEFDLPPERAYGSAGGIHTRRQCTLIRVRTEDGIEGYGESRGPYRLVKANIDVLSSVFLGTDIRDRDITLNQFRNRLYHYGHQGPLIVAYSGLNIAMLDALGKAMNLPVCRLIGGMARPEVSVYATGGYLTRGPASRYEQQLESLQATGLPIAKIKIGQGPVSDEERVATARRYLGDSV
jgi:D-galactarolactone cycloisomerase